MGFAEKLATAIATHHSLWCLGLDPNPEVMPETYRSRYAEDPTHARVIQNLWDWMHRVIETTADLVCAYKPTLGFYTALGPAGLELLNQTLAAIPPEIPVILDAKHADLNSGTVMAKTAFEQWNVDAITISPFLGQELAARFLMYPDKAILVSCYSANLTAQAIQAYPEPTRPLYLKIVEEAQAWASADQLGLEVGITSPDHLAQIRARAPERWILGRSLWAQQRGTQLETLQEILTAGLNDQGSGLILPVNQDILTADQPDEPLRSLRQQTNALIEQITSQRPAICTPWLPDVCLLDRQPHADLILELFDLGCIQFGEHVQASGAVFPYYIDLRKIISNPQVFDAVITAYADILKHLQFDRIAGIPYGSLPTASGLALRLNRPLIFPRKEVKAYGARRLVEGNYESGETAVVVDDILISGNSAVEGANKLESCGLVVRDIVVFLDHGGGVCERLATQGYRAQAVLTLAEINETLYSAGRISEAQLQLLSQSH
jgi:uridine monophosphate synthetase